MAHHFKYAPSKMHRTILCSASTAVESLYPNTRNDFADEGTVAHHIAAICLKNGSDAELFLGTSWNVNDKGDVTQVTKGGKFGIDSEFAQYVQVYLNSVRRRSYGHRLMVEQRVFFNAGPYVEEMQGGTSDAVIYVADERHLIVQDLKFGRGVKVFASHEGKPNAQGATYAVATLETLADVIGPVDTITIVISQPRLDHEDEFTMTLAQLQSFTEDMHTATARSETACAILADGKEIPETYFTPGDKQCTFCKHAGDCNAFTKWVSTVALDDYKALDDPNSGLVGLNPRIPGRDKLGIRFANIELVQQWCKAVSAATYSAVGNGEKIIGPDEKPLKFVAGKRGNRTWKDEKIATGVLAGHLPADKLYKPRELITPAVADGLLNKKKTAATWELIKPLYGQGDGKPVLVLGSDPRPVYEESATTEEFEDLRTLADV